MPTIIRSFVDSCFCWIIINNVKLSARTILGQAIRGLPRKIVIVPYVIDDQKTHIGRQEIDCIGPYMGNGICKVHHWYHHHNMGRVALPNRMNFRKGSKRQLTPTPHPSEWSPSLEIMCMHFILSGPRTSLHIFNHIH